MIMQEESNNELFFIHFSELSKEFQKRLVEKYHVDPSRTNLTAFEMDDEHQIHMYLFGDSAPAQIEADSSNKSLYAHQAAQIVNAAISQPKLLNMVTIDDEKDKPSNEFSEDSTIGQSLQLWRYSINKQYGNNTARLENLSNRFNKILSDRISSNNRDTYSTRFFIQKINELPKEIQDWIIFQCGDHLDKDASLFLFTEAEQKCYLVTTETIPNMQDLNGKLLFQINQIYTSKERETLTAITPSLYHLDIPEEMVNQFYLTVTKGDNK